MIGWNLYDVESCCGYNIELYVRPYETGRSEAFWLIEDDKGQCIDGIADTLAEAIRDARRESKCFRSLVGEKV